jgi:prepilin-type N-terminal cleavage/methylation domain-containing protein
MKGVSPVRTSKRQPAGFTLIELLVVISIIAVLISILLPALAAARAEGQKLKDLANMRGVGSTGQAYASDDPKGILGVVHPEDKNFSGGTGYMEYGGGAGMMRYTGWNQEFDPRTRPYNHLIYGRNGIARNIAPGTRGFFINFECPGEERGWQQIPSFDSNPFETEPNSYFKGNGTAYRMNNLAFEGGFSTGIYGRPINRIPDTSQTLMLMESRVFQTLFTNEVWGSLDPTVLTGYHRKLGWFTVIYSDGHSDYKNFGRGTYYRHIQMPPHLADYQDTDARGTWGRMDCWPEPQFDPRTP